MSEDVVGNRADMVFDGGATISRMSIVRLYEQEVNRIVTELNSEIEKGPFKGVVRFISYRPRDRGFDLVHGFSSIFRYTNRIKAYGEYYKKLKEKYSLQIEKLNQN